MFVVDVDVDVYTKFNTSNMHIILNAIGKSTIKTFNHISDDVIDFELKSVSFLFENLECTNCAIYITVPGCGTMKLDMKRRCQ